MIHIHLVEDSEDDIALLRYHLAKFPYATELNVMKTVKEALASFQLLAQAAGTASENLGAHIVLLDLNLDPGHGFDVLNFIQKNPALKNIPVFIVSASEKPEEFLNAYRFGGCGFLKKPLTLEVLKQSIQQLILTNRLKIA